MTRLRRRPRANKNRRSARRDSGSLSVYAAVLAPALLMCASLFVNAAVRWNSWRDANAAADAAARAAVQVTPEEFDGNTLTVSTALAQQRAQSVLNASGYTGQVSVSGGSVTVEVVASVEYVLPGGWFGPTVSGTGVAHMESGVMSGSP